MVSLRDVIISKIYAFELCCILYISSVHLTLVYNISSLHFSMFRVLLQKMRSEVPKIRRSWAALNCDADKMIFFFVESYKNNIYVFQNTIFLYITFNRNKKINNSKTDMVTGLRELKKLRIHQWLFYLAWIPYKRKSISARY